MPEFTITLPELHADQKRLIAQRKRFNVVVCGRRWGKTVFGQDIAINGALDGKKIGWFADTYKRLDETFFKFKQLFPDAICITKDSTKRLLRLKNGGLIECWSVEQDEDAARSRDYDIVVIDEAGLLPKLDVVWREAIRATLLDRRGEAWILGTPKPPKAMQLKDYPLYQFFTRCGSEDGEDWASFRSPSQSNPHMNADDINAMRKEPGMTARIARQEIDAEFLSENTDALWNMALIDNTRKLGYQPEFVRKVLFLDPGNFSNKDSADPCGIVLAGEDANRHYYVINDLSGAYTPLKCAQLVTRAARHYGARIYYETNQGGEYVKHAIQQVDSVVPIGVPSVTSKEQRALVPLQGYELGVVHHLWEFVDMEQEMVSWNPYDKSMKSPNRMDALVGALNAMMKGGGSGMTVTKAVSSNSMV